ncbi:MAG: methionyl-tRNA formyltransferase [Gemmatimonadales bacterium]|jgi:methionyl-tRNA formyltransferase|nr:MAG: methionyl-tRNA formyltransferase [Gemmatimonadales bacterium]
MHVLFWGTPEFAVPTLRALTEEGHDVVGVVTQPDRPAGRGRTLQPSPVKQLAEEEGIPVLTPERPVGEAFLAQLRELKPEISVVVAYGHILKPEVLEFPPRGSWNVHASLLPELRGAAPIHWAIAQGHDATGISIMRMTEGMDAGPVLHQVVEPIGPHETSSELAERLAEIGAQALIESLALLEFGDAEPLEQDHDRATFAPKVSREVARVDWSRPAVEVANHIRAMDSVPGAWTEWEGEPLKLFSPGLDAPEGWVRSAAPEAEDGGPGTVVVADPSVPGTFAVATGQGIVWIGEVQPPGKKRMPAEAWLRGRGAQAGQRLGS